MSTSAKGMSIASCESERVALAVNEVAYSKRRFRSQFVPDECSLMSYGSKRATALPQCLMQFNPASGWERKEILWNCSFSLTAPTILLRSTLDGAVRHCGSGAQPLDTPKKVAPSPVPARTFAPLCLNRERPLPHVEIERKEQLFTRVETARITCGNMQQKSRCWHCQLSSATKTERTGLSL